MPPSTKPWRVPIAVPAGQYILITQGYGPTSVEMEPPGPNGEPHFHYGIDLVSGDDHHTYGLGVVCPFPTAMEYNEEFTEPMGPVGNFHTISHTDEQGVSWRMMAYHLSDVEVASPYSEGTVIGHIGNTGMVWPKPSIIDPYAGAHLHLQVWRNGVIVDPLLYFDTSRPYSAGPTPQRLEMPPADWVVKKILALFSPFTTPAPAVT